MLAPHGCGCGGLSPTPAQNIQHRVLFDLQLYKLRRMMSAEFKGPSAAMCRSLMRRCGRTLGFSTSCGFSQAAVASIAGSVTRGALTFGCTVLMLPFLILLLRPK